MLTTAQLRDVAERAGATFVQTFVAVFTPVVITAAQSQTFDVPTIKAAALSAGAASGAAALSVVKGWIATHFGDGTASTVTVVSDQVVLDENAV